MDVRKGIHFQRGVYAVLRFLFGGLFCLFTKHTAKKYKPKSETFLLLANHTCDFDPIYAVVDTKSHMKFVAAANLTRGFGGWFIKNLAGPIPREKGASADSVVASIKECLDNDISVAMYPEGITTWDGESAFISKRTAKLVKESKGGLVTYVTVGGYFKTPRWAVIKRSGKTESWVVNEYTRDYLDTLSEDEIYDIICKDLYIDAYEAQKTRHWKYDCSARAEGLEGALYVCKECKRFGTLRSQKHSFKCEACGAEWFFTDEAYLEKTDTEGLEKQSETILDWSRWQKKYLHDNAKMLSECVENPICTNGIFTAFGDRLVVNGESFYYKDITAMSIFRSSRLFFTCNDKHYEFYLDGSTGRVGQMYFALWRICTGKDYF